MLNKKKTYLYLLLFLVFFIVFLEFFSKIILYTNTTFFKGKEIILSAISDIKTYLNKNFGKVKITLGDFQKLVRGENEIPIWGLPDVITAMSSVKYKNGVRKVYAGESYIGLVRFNKDGPILESIMSFGNSDDPDSNHFVDQMNMYSKFQTKKMTFERKEIYRNAKSIYNPN